MTVFICFPPKVSVLVMCHTRELAFQISKEYERFSKYMPNVKVSQGKETWESKGVGCWMHWRLVEQQSSCLKDVKYLYTNLIYIK